MKQMFDFQQGEVLLLNKPYTWTSFDLVKKVRNLVRIKKVGHAGTLDPLATGLMIVCTGAKTKQIESLTGLDKTYTGSMRLGETTPSYDLETSVDARYPISHLTEAAIHEAVKLFLGPQEQVPPAHSAVKVDGKRAYQNARKGIEMILKPRVVNIMAFEITNIDLPRVSFSVQCSKGTYIRSLVHDFGKSLGSGAVLTELCRTAIGSYQLTDALELKNLEQLVKAQNEQKDAGLSGN
jgi:tRNA pseudouridine55 synthase